MFCAFPLQLNFFQFEAFKTLVKKCMVHRGSKTRGAQGIFAVHKMLTAHKKQQEKGAFYLNRP